MSSQPHQHGRSLDCTFASTLRQQRLQNGLSLAQLALRVGCAKSYLSSIENGHKGPPTASIIEKLEQALSFQSGELFSCAQWDQTPMPIREDLEQLRQRDETVSSLARMLAQSARDGASLDKLYESGVLRKLIDRIDPVNDAEEEHEKEWKEEGVEKEGAGKRMAPLGMLPMEVPLINKVTAGYPADFSDLGYPARIADEYVRAPDLNDPDAFAARVVGDSMDPNYREGDIVVFSPAREIVDGMDCFVRLERDDESTFKRVYFQTDEAGNEMIRIQPINNSYPPMTVARQEVAGLYAGVSVTRTIG
ncbi:MAG: LexA family transcriptional regulator [Phycisphaerales bacterium]|nr:LexA family transcriptional regulator [Phycisphaerales bacterium]